MNTTIIILAAIIIAGAVILTLISRSQKKKGLSGKDLAFIKEKWEEILNSSEKEAKHAIVEADKLLDHVMHKKGFQGTVAEKLKKAQHMMSEPESVWSVHKMRNRIAHEIDYKIQEHHAKNALKHFKKALNDLGAKL